MAYNHAAGIVAGSSRKTRGRRPTEPQLDLLRAFVFPNRVREIRLQRDLHKLLALSTRLPELPYVRLSKIERGEVFARADELRRIALALGVVPGELLVDVDAPDFDLEAWAEPFRDTAADDPEEARFAILLGAAVRERRTGDPALTIAEIDRRFGLAPVNLSRVENAAKPFARWNDAVRDGLFALFDVTDEAALRAHVADRHAAGALDSYFEQVANPAARLDRTRERIAALASELAEGFAARPVIGLPASAPTGAALPHPSVALRGGAMPDGLIADLETGERIEAPASIGPRAFGLRIHRATLGGGLPVHSCVVADPDRSPVPGGLAVLREAGGWRVLVVASDREGCRIGYSLHPEREIELDDCDPHDLAAIVSAIFP